MNFISAFVDYTKKYESPTSFWKWSAYATIGAILRDSCYGTFSDIHIFPNIFVLLLADSAVHRKGNPVKFCENFVSSIKNTKVISGRSSIQAILDELARGETDKNGKILTGGSAIWVAPELSAGIVNDLEAVKILTDIYDFRTEYTSRLRGTGVFKIKNVCFTMLAASNEELLRSIYDTKAIFGGLLGRTFLVFPDEFRPANSLFDAPMDRSLKDGLIQELKQISELRGEFVFEDCARYEYESWYKPFRESYKDRSDKSGVVGRIHTSVLKLSMILSATKTKGIQVKKEHIEEAIEESINLLPNYNRFLMASGKSPLAEVGTIVITEIYGTPGRRITRKKLLQKCWQNVDAENLDKLVTTMSQAGMIEQYIEGNEIAYQLTEKAISIIFKK